MPALGKLRQHNLKKVGHSVKNQHLKALSLISPLNTRPVQAYFGPSQSPKVWFFSRSAHRRILYQTFKREFTLMSETFLSLVISSVS